MKAGKRGGQERTGKGSWNWGRRRKGKGSWNWGRRGTGKGKESTKEKVLTRTVEYLFAFLPLFGSPSLLRPFLRWYPDPEVLEQEIILWKGFTQGTETDRRVRNGGGGDRTEVYDGLVILAEHCFSVLRSLFHFYFICHSQSLVMSFFLFFFFSGAFSNLPTLFSRSPTP